jgi:hypothetical protein
MSMEAFSKDKYGLVELQKLRKLAQDRGLATTGTLRTLRMRLGRHPSTQRPVDSTAAPAAPPTISPYFQPASTTEEESQPNEEGDLKNHITDITRINSTDQVPLVASPLQGLGDGPQGTCTSCVMLRAKCTRISGEKKCQPCLKRKRGCREASRDQILCAADSCSSCRYTRLSLSCTRTSSYRACNHCIASQKSLTCRPVRVSAVPKLLPEGRCYTCQEDTHGRRYRGISRVECDGIHPCNVCKRKRRTCISTTDKDNSSCLRCDNGGYTCDRGNPCVRCWKLKLVCSRFLENDTEHVAYYPDGEVDHIADDACIACSRTGRLCTDHHPCYQCLTMDMAAYKSIRTCTKKEGRNTLRSREKAAYSLDQANQVVYNPCYRGGRLVSRIPQRQRRKGTLNFEELPGDDPDES